MRRWEFVGYVGSGFRGTVSTLPMSDMTIPVHVGENRGGHAD